MTNKAIDQFVNGLPDGAPDEGTSTPDGAAESTLLKDNSRGRFLQLAFNAALVGTAALAGVSCRKDMPSVTDNMMPITTSPKKSTSGSELGRLNVEEDTSIEPPEFELDWDGKVFFDAPDFMQKTMKADPEIVSEVTDNIKLAMSVVERLRPDLFKLRENPAEFKKKFLVFYKTLIEQMFLRGNKDVAWDVSDASRRCNGDMYCLSDYLNRYLQFAGCYLYHTYSHRTSYGSRFDFFFFNFFLPGNYLI